MERDIKTLANKIANAINGDEIHYQFNLLHDWVSSYTNDSSIGMPDIPIMRVITQSCGDDFDTSSPQKYYDLLNEMTRTSIILGDYVENSSRLWVDKFIALMDDKKSIDEKLYVLFSHHNDNVGIVDFGFTVNSDYYGNYAISSVNEADISDNQYCLNSPILKALEIADLKLDSFLDISWREHPNAKWFEEIIHDFKNSDKNRAFVEMEFNFHFLDILRMETMNYTNGESALCAANPLSFSINGKQYPLQNNGKAYFISDDFTLNKCKLETERPEYEFPKLGQVTTNNNSMNEYRNNHLDLAIGDIDWDVMWSRLQDFDFLDNGYISQNQFEEAVSCKENDFDHKRTFTLH